MPGAPLRRLALLTLPCVALSALVGRRPVAAHPPAAAKRRALSLRQGAKVARGAEDDTSHTLAGFVEIEHDLVETEDDETQQIKNIDMQIAGLVRKRDALKVEQAKRKRDIAFVHLEEQGLKGRSAAAATAASSAAVSAAASSASADTATVEVAASTDSEAEAVAAQAEAEAEASVSAAEEQRQKSEAAAAAAQEKAQAKAEVQAQAKAEAQAQAEAKHQAEVEEARRKAKEEAEAEEQKRRMAEDSEYRHRMEQRKQMDEMADSADDSFKQFMKEEDGEDQMGDADYEDSANALAGAIGWNRKEIETKADSAVKQLTQAIGGKKVVQSLQGMMAGIGR